MYRLLAIETSINQTNYVKWETLSNDLVELNKIIKKEVHRNYLFYRY
jgi:hypothetical protein